jgi:integrase
VITKGGVPRIVPLTRQAYDILWRRRADHETHFFTFVAARTRKCPKTGKLFVKGERYPITYYGLGSNKRKWAKAGVSARIHDLRHTAASRTLRSTGNLKLVQTLLGHADIKITAEFYANARSRMCARRWMRPRRHSRRRRCYLAQKRRRANDDCDLRN